MLSEYESRWAIEQVQEQLLARGYHRHHASPIESGVQISEEPVAQANDSTAQPLVQSTWASKPGVTVSDV